MFFRDDFIFCGFYNVKKLIDEKDLKEKELLEIGPYQAMIIPCPKITYGKGVCGTAWKTKKV